jgi:ABC-type Fe3+-hydroxamate transport system substrate-binding protein
MHGSNSNKTLVTVTILLALTLSACGGDGGSQSATSTTTNGSGGTGTTPTVTVPGTAPLSISGAPNRQVVANQPYWFRPTANNSNGAVLRFGIANQPGWANFNSATGELTGTPSSADVGVYRGVTVTVTAGTQMRALAFDVEVVQVGTSSITFTWTPPTENEDGTPLTNLAGYRLRYGVQSGNYTSVVNLANPGLATYVLGGLAAGTYYVVITAYNQSGAESQFSNEATAPAI